MKAVLFIESGVFGGGSFVSLKKHVYALNLNEIRPVIVFFNDNELIAEFKAKNIKTYLIKDSVFTRGRSKTYAIANALFMKGYLQFLIIPFLRLLHKKSISAVSDICKKEEVDIIHVNTELFRDRVGLLVGSNLNLPVISHLRSKYELGTIVFNKQYIAFANKTVHKYIAVSTDTAAFWINEVGILSDKCQVLYDYYQDINMVKPAMTQIRPNPIFVCVANLIPVKAHPFLLKSLAPIIKKHNAILRLVGRGEQEYTNELKELTISLGIVKQVNFMGFRPDIPEILIDADIVFLLSKREGLPNILIEALGLGCVVVVSKVGGIPEIIEDKINGFVVPYGDISYVNQIVECILQSADGLNEIRSEAITSVTKKFNIESYKKIAAKLYE